MSIGFDLDTRGQRERNDSSMLSVGTLDEVSNPGFFAGFGGTAMSTLAHGARSCHCRGAVPAIADWVTGDDNLSGRSLADQYFAAVDGPTRAAVDYWKPSPQASGIGGRVGGALAGSLVQLAATGETHRFCFWISSLAQRRTWLTKVLTRPRHKWLAVLKAWQRRPAFAWAPMATHWPK